MERHDLQYHIYAGETREGFLRKKHSCGFIFSKVLYTNILNTCTYLFH